jgi:hypothetical protein
MLPEFLRLWFVMTLDGYVIMPSSSLRHVIITFSDDLFSLYDNATSVESDIQLSGKSRTGCSPITLAPADLGIYTCHCAGR